MNSTEAPARPLPGPASFPRHQVDVLAATERIVTLLEAYNDGRYGDTVRPYRSLLAMGVTIGVHPIPVSSGKGVTR